MHSAKNVATAVAISAAPVVAGGGLREGTNLVLPGTCKNSLQPHTHTYTYTI
jgi:hypothetical protein